MFQSHTEPWWAVKLTTSSTPHASVTNTNVDDVVKVSSIDPAETIEFISIHIPAADVHRAASFSVLSGLKKSVCHLRSQPARGGRSFSVPPVTPQGPGERLHIAAQSANQSQALNVIKFFK